MKDQWSEPVVKVPAFKGKCKAKNLTICVILNARLAEILNRNPIIY